MWTTNSIHANVDHQFATIEDYAGNIIQEYGKLMHSPRERSWRVHA